MHMGRHSAGRELGMTQGETREATKRLKTANHIAVKPTSLGSVVTLISRSVFDITDDANNQRNLESPARQQPANNQPTATNEEGIRENERKCEGAEPPPPAHSQFPSWFSEVAAEHPTKDAEACWPIYFDNCDRKGLPPSKISFDEWLGREEKRLRRVTKQTPKLPEPPSNWREVLKNAYPDNDVTKHNKPFSEVPPNVIRELFPELLKAL
jgi:hypothetical protein